MNSYKRLNAATSSSGATWSPTTITYGGNNRTLMIRIPDSGRFECRLPDGAANPYLLPAALIAAGLDGINEKRDPGVSTHTNLYTDVIASTLPHLPSNLLDALRELEGNAILQNRLGPEFISAYLKLKYQEWNDYSSHLSRWELRHTMDC